MKHDLEEAAMLVAKDHHQYEEALDGVRTAEANVLDQVLDDITMALPAILNRSRDGHLTPVTLLPPVNGSPSSLLLAEDGLRIGSDPFAATSFAIITAGWKLQNIIESIRKLLDQQISGGKTQAIEMLHKRATKLQAVAELIKNTR